MILTSIMGSNNAPSGFGMWIAFGQTIGTLAKVIQLAKDCGAEWIAPRAGESTWNDVWWAQQGPANIVKACHDAGLKCYPWVYSHPTTCMGEIARYKLFMDQGADGVFIDAELEWQNAANNGPIAEQFLSQLRKTLGDDAFIGHAPFPYISWHAQFPYEQFGKYCDQVHPQTYWSEISDAGAAHHIAATQSQWDAVAKSKPAVLGAAGAICHIGVTYGKEIGGTTPGVFRPSDLAYFMKWCKDHQLPSYSVYSLDAMNPLAHATLKALKDGTAVPADPVPGAPKRAPVAVTVVAPPVVVAPVAPVTVQPEVVPVQVVQPIPPTPVPVAPVINSVPRKLALPVPPFMTTVVTIVWSVLKFIVAFIANRGKK